MGVATSFEALAAFDSSMRDSRRLPVIGDRGALADEEGVDEDEFAAAVSGDAGPLRRNGTG